MPLQPLCKPLLQCLALLCRLCNVCALSLMQSISRRPRCKQQETRGETTKGETRDMDDSNATQRRTDTLPTNKPRAHLPIESCTIHNACSACSACLMIRGANVLYHSPLFRIRAESQSRSGFVICHCLACMLLQGPLPLPLVFIRRVSARSMSYVSSSSSSSSSSIHPRFQPISQPIDRSTNPAISTCLAPRRATYRCCKAGQLMG